MRKSWFVRYFVILPEDSNLKALWDFLIYFSIAANFLLTPFTLAFDDNARGQSEQSKVIWYTGNWEAFFDICFMIHICGTFLTAYQHDLDWIVMPKEIAKNYLRSTFCLDLLSTLPSLIMGQENYQMYWFKLLRFVHMSTFLKLLNIYLSKILLRFGVDKQVVDKLFYFLVLVLYLIFVVHILSCAWVLIGYESPGSWIDAAGLAGDDSLPDDANGSTNSTISTNDAT